MGGSLFLTLFLLIGGAFTVWCAARDYDWYFKVAGLPMLFINTVGRRAARVIYILAGLGMLSWGVSRVVDPPPTIAADFIYDLGRPHGIDLVDSRATEELKLKPEAVFGLQTDELGWTSFWMLLTKDSPHYESAALSSDAGPDFSEGFALSRRMVNGKPLQGRIIYFSAEMESCDNVIFSKKPLSSAAFVMVISSKALSDRHSKGGIPVHFFRAGTELYSTVTK